MIYTVTLNPALDKTVEIPGMALDTVNRITEMRTDPGGKGINVSKVIAKLGGESCAVGILGGGSGKMLEKLLEGEPFATRYAKRSRPGRTTSSRICAFTGTSRNARTTWSLSR